MSDIMYLVLSHHLYQHIIPMLTNRKIADVCNYLYFAQFTFFILKSIFVIVWIYLH